MNFQDFSKGFSIWVIWITILLAKYPSNLNRPLSQKTMRIHSENYCATFKHGHSNLLNHNHNTISLFSVWTIDFKL